MPHWRLSVQAHRQRGRPRSLKKPHSSHTCTNNARPRPPQGIPRDGDLADLLTEAKAPATRFTAVVCEARRQRDRPAAQRRPRPLPARRPRHRLESRRGHRHPPQPQIHRAPGLRPPPPQAGRPGRLMALDAAPVHPAIVDQATWDTAQAIGAEHGSARDDDAPNTIRLPAAPTSCGPGCGASCASRGCAASPAPTATGPTGIMPTTSASSTRPIPAIPPPARTIPVPSPPARTSWWPSCGTA